MHFKVELVMDIPGACENCFLTDVRYTSWEIWR